MYRPDHPDAHRCLTSFVGGGFFERNNTTPTRYWSEAIALWGAADLLLTAFLVGAFCVTRWVVRGFAGA